MPTIINGQDISTLRTGRRSGSNSNQSLQAIQLGLQMGQSEREMQMNRALTERKLAIAEKQQDVENKRTTALDLGNADVRNAQIKQYQTGDELNQLKLKEIKSAQEQQKKDRESKMGLPDFLFNEYVNPSRSPQNNIEKLNAALKANGVPDGSLVKSRTRNPDGSIVINYNSGESQTLGQDQVYANIHKHYPDMRDYIHNKMVNDSTILKVKNAADKTASNEKIKLQSEEAKQRKEDLKNASGLADLPAAGYDVSVFERMDDNGAMSKDYKGLEYFDKVYQKNLATMGDKDKALKATATALRIPSFQSQLDAVKKDKMLSTEAKVSARQEILAKMNQNQSPMVPMNTQAQPEAPQGMDMVSKAMDIINRIDDPVRKQNALEALKKRSNTTAPIETTASLNIKSIAPQSTVQYDEGQKINLPTAIAIPGRNDSRTVRKTDPIKGKVMSVQLFKSLTEPEPPLTQNERKAGVPSGYMRVLNDLQKRLKDSSDNAERELIAQNIMRIKQSRTNPTLDRSEYLRPAQTAINIANIPRALVGE